ILIDGGNSYYIDDIRRAKELVQQRIHYVDVGTSGGVWGLERGLCLMIGGGAKGGSHLRSDFGAPAPGVGGMPNTPRSREAKGDCRTGLPALWSERRRPFCEDGPQRNGVRHHGCLRRRDGCAALLECWQTETWN